MGEPFRFRHAKYSSTLLTSLKQKTAQGGFLFSVEVGGIEPPCKRSRLSDSTVVEIFEV